MRKRTDRAVALVLLLLQTAMLTFVPAARAAAGTPIGMDFCRAASAMPATQNPPDSPETPAVLHSAHACGDCCTAHAGPVPAAADPLARVAPLSTPPVIADTSSARARSATVLPPACGPPAAA